MATRTRLPLGADPMGRAWALNFRTGNVESLSDAASLVEASNTSLISFGELSPERLTRILSEGGWTVRAEKDRPDVLMIQTELGGIVATVHGEGRFLRLIRVFGWDCEEEDLETPEDRAEAVERLNRTAYVVRFIPTDNPVPGITAILDVPLTGGITRAQVLDLMRRYLLELTRAIDITGVREGLL